MILAETSTSNDVTTLGSFFTEQTGSLQVGIIVVTAFLATYSIAESFEAVFKERKNELTMYRAIGWSKTQIIRFYSGEYCPLDSGYLNNGVSFY